MLRRLWRLARLVALPQAAASFAKVYRRAVRRAIEDELGHGIIDGGVYELTGKRLVDIGIVGFKGVVEGAS